jgi:integrase
MQHSYTQSWADLMPDYITYLEAGKKSPRTVELRVYQIRRLAKDAGLEPAEVKTQHLIDMLSNPRWKPNTVATARASYASFFGWGRDFRRLKKNPAAILPTVKVPAGKPKPASDAAFANALSQATPRVALMVRIGAYAGLRAMEIAQLHSSMVTLSPRKNPKKSRAFLTITGKGSKTRIVPIGIDLADELLAKDGWIFPGRIDGHVSPAYVSKLVSRVLPPGVTCHKLRHRFATRAYRNSGHNLRALQKLMGHASIATTQVYTDVDDDELWATALSAA